jgi:hypothetical protein
VVPEKTDAGCFEGNDSTLDKFPLRRPSETLEEAVASDIFPTFLICNNENVKT